MFHIDKATSNRIRRRTRITGSRQRGQGMTEYVIIVALIAISAILVVTMFGGSLRAQFAGASTELSGESAEDMIEKSQEYANCARSDAGVTRPGMAGYANDFEGCSGSAGGDTGPSLGGKGEG